jgi:hypothetical protein
LTMQQSEILRMQSPVPSVPSVPILEAKPPSRSPQSFTVPQMASSIADQSFSSVPSIAANSSLLDQLRASGLLSKVSSDTVSIQEGTDASIQNPLSVRPVPNRAASTSKWHDTFMRT